MPTRVIGTLLRNVHVFIHLDDCAVNAFREYLSGSRKEASRQIKGEQGGVVERERALGCSWGSIGARPCARSHGGAAVDLDGRGVVGGSG